MTLEELVDRVRTAARDTVAPFLLDGDDIIAWLNEAQAEAVVRARLLHETADPALCAIAIDAGEGSASLHKAMYELTYQAFRKAGETARAPLSLVSQEWLDREMPDWRERTGTPQYLLQDEQALRLAPIPEVGGEVLLEGYRLPIKRMRDDNDQPEIAALHHLHLVQWALYRGFSVPDADAFDPNRAAQAEAEFTRYFGPRPDADLRRATREDEPHHVEAIWP